MKANIASVGPKECQKNNLSIKKYYGEKYFLYGVDGRNLGLSKQNLKKKKTCLFPSVYHFSSSGLLLLFSLHLYSPFSCVRLDNHEILFNMKYYLTLKINGAVDI